METSDKSARQLYEAIKANPTRPRFGFGRKAAVINVDLQKAYTNVGEFATAYETDPKQMDYVNEISDLARSKSLPVIWTYVGAAIVIASANDACVAVAEHLGGTVDGFVDLMNDKAQSIGLTHTHCVNVHGLDDTPVNAGNMTSARDLSQIALSLIRHPQILSWSSLRSAPFRDGKFKLWATNRLLGKFRDLDGLKTGYTQRAGYNLVATAERRDMRLVSVVLGARQEKLRDKESARLLSWGFNNFVKAPIATAGDSAGVVPLDWGIDPSVTAVTRDGAIAVLTTEERRRLHHEVRLPTLHEAPVAEGDSLGVLAISLDDSLIAEIDLIAATSVERMSVWEKLMSYF